MKHMQVVAGRAVKAFCGKCSKNVIPFNTLYCPHCRKPIWELSAEVNRTSVDQSHASLRRIALAARKA